MVRARRFFYFILFFLFFFISSNSVLSFCCFNFLFLIYSAGLPLFTALFAAVPARPLRTLISGAAFHMIHLIILTASR
ncbi:MAG TPA: hypothetical protein DCZ10_14335 [Pelotomaculum sp.]|nr:hypothetical protein [Pelotomaculum sp.]